MSSLPESVTKTKHWPMWVGSQADLLRLLRIVEKRYEPLLPDYVSEATEHRKSMLESKISQKPRILERRQAQPDDPYWQDRLVALDADIIEERGRLNAAETDAMRAARIDLTLTGPENERRSVTGTASELVDYLDGRRLEELEFSAPSGHIPSRSISIRASRRNGPYLRVSSKDAEWCIAGFSELSDEISKQVPKWSFVRNPLFLWLFFYLTSAIVFYCVGNIIALAATPTGKFTASGAYWATAIHTVASIVTSIAGVGLTRTIIPAFEVLSQGQPSRGSRALRWLGSAATAVILAILANAISSVLLA